MREKSALPASLIALLLAMIWAFTGEVGGEEEEVPFLEDEEGDVLIRSEIRIPESFWELEKVNQPGNQEEGASIDILSLTILENDTYISFVIRTVGKIQSNPLYKYAIAGYTSEEPLDSDPFDFMLIFQDGAGSYNLWSDGGLKRESNLSKPPLIAGNELELTMNRNLFVLSSPEDPFRICAFAIRDSSGEGRTHLMDYLIQEDDQGGNGLALDDMTIIMLELGFFLMLFAVILIIYNYWAKKKGITDQGGVCPKCESKLDTSLDFCPSCGAFVRGPKADVDLKGEANRPGKAGKG